MDFCFLCAAYTNNSVASRYDAVALDGTYYQKNGFISGGSTDLAKRARRWDDKAFHTLKARKEKLTEELKEMMKRTRKESDLTTLQSQIRGLETRVRYSVTDRDNIRNKSMANLEREIARLEQELSRQEPLLKKLEEEMRTKEAQYEERELRATQERDRKRLEFENQKSRIVNRLEYERSKDTGENVRKWQKTVEDDEKELENLKQAEQAQMHSIDEQMQALEKLKSSKISKKQELDGTEESMGEIRKRLTAVQKEIASVQKALTALEARQEQRRQDRHSVFQTCKLEQIPLRLVRGSLDDLDATAPTDDAAAGDEVAASQASITKVYEREGQIEVDYSVLPDELTELDTPEEVKREGNRLNKEIADMQSHLQRIQAPNMRAMEKYVALTFMWNVKNNKAHDKGTKGR
ncbi:hypothetical protein HPB49_025820 [Dermacentor silvarum]|nr:hypothetical protein HPB49_025820 [Dermacentor silvarum]